MARCSRVCGIGPSSAATIRERRVDTADPGQHVLDEALVAGDVDDADLAAARQTKPGETEVDRHRRAFSSARRSGSIPVSALTSVDLP